MDVRLGHLVAFDGVQRVVEEQTTNETSVACITLICEERRSVLALDGLHGHCARPQLQHALLCNSRED